jgi:hypothetical protein
VGVTIAVGSLAPEMLTAEPAIVLCAVLMDDDATCPAPLTQAIALSYRRTAVRPDVQMWVPSRTRTGGSS